MSATAIQKCLKIADAARSAYLGASFTPFFNAVLWPPRSFLWVALDSCKAESTLLVMASKTGRVAVLWRGDREVRRTATPQTSRSHRIFEALQAQGIAAEPAVFSEAVADEVRTQLLGVNGVLVWVDPLSEGQTRAVLDLLLREVASRGIWVTAHPDVILKMGVKEVLHRTRHLGWGTDTRLYRSIDALCKEFPCCLADQGPRVLKRNRGNGGQGVWKVEPGGQPAQGPQVQVLEARRGSGPQEWALPDFLGRLAEYFQNDGCIIDQPFQPRLRRA